MKIDKSNFGGEIRGSWRGAISKENAPETENEFIVSNRPFYLSKRFIGSSIFAIGCLLEIKYKEIGEAVKMIGGSIAGIGLVHAGIKSSPKYNGRAGWFFRLINYLTKRN